MSHLYSLTAKNPIPTVELCNELLGKESWSNTLISFVLLVGMSPHH